MNFPSLPSSPSLSPLILGHIFRPHLCRALALFGARASFILNDGFLYWERIQDLPIKWWRYIIGLIRQSYYEPAGARCHQSGWKSISLDSDPSGLNNAAFHFNIISAPTIKRLYIHAVTLLFSEKPTAPGLCGFRKTHTGTFRDSADIEYHILMDELRFSPNINKLCLTSVISRASLNKSYGSVSVPTRVCFMSLCSRHFSHSLVQNVWKIM